MAITSFVITGSQLLPGRVEVIGNLSGTAPGGNYKVPVRIVYPTGFSNARAIIEPWNSAGVDVFATGTPAAVAAQALASTCYNIAQVPYLVGGTPSSQGYTYVTHEWSKYVVDVQLAAAAAVPNNQGGAALPIPFDPTWAIPQGTDAYQIMADVSALARNPIAFNPFAGLAPPPVNGKVIGYGFSQVGQLQRGFASQLLNSGLGGGFPGGLVYEAILAVSNGAFQRIQNNIPPGYSVNNTFYGATAASEGVFVNLSSEMELLGMEAFRARADDAANPHYRTYEMAGVAHTPGDLAGAQLPILRNPIFQRPVHRGMFAAILANLDAAIPLPPSAYLEGTEATRTAPVFTTSTSYITGVGFGGWTTVNTFTGVVSEDDGNFEGGIRLPHLRTILPTGQAVGAPLGTYRGSWISSLTIPAQTVANAGQIAPSVVGRNVPFLRLQFNTGIVSPWDPCLIMKRYRDISEYRTFVAQAADSALGQRWITALDRDEFIAAANATTYQQLIDFGLRRLVPPTPIEF
jgi:hypothetical protein